MKHKFLFSVFIIFFILVFVALGSWQIVRLNWKNNLILEIENSLKNPPVELTNSNVENYLKIKTSGSIDLEKQIYLYNLNDTGTPGFEVINPILINDTNYLINRGWIPFEKKNSQEINVFDENDIIGTLKLQGRKNIFKPDNNLEENYWFSLNREDILKFTGKEFSKYIGNKYSVAVSNGSVALEIALKALNLNKNDQVIVTPRSFIISASCVINCGLKPVFADVDHNGNLSMEGIKKVYSNKIKAIIVVHLNGMPCELDPIIKFSKKFKLKIIEDCSQAHGAEYNKRSVGSFGDISTWSFCQDKIITTGGEGGMISTNDKKLWEKCWSHKDHGKDYYSVFYKKHKLGFKWLHENYGTNHRMTEFQAAIGRYQLKYLDTQIPY